MKLSKAIGLSVFWVLLALLFNAGIYYYQGQGKALEFLAGYLIELSLSVDNIFVFILIFKYFKIPREKQTKILFWGVLGAQVMRAIFIVAGLALLNRFQWLVYILGAFLLFTGVKLFFEKDKEVNPEGNPLIKIVKKMVPTISQFWIVLIVVEATDLIFALDSIPAVLAVTKDPFIVYSSNLFAVLGLRAMYFALAGIMPMFRFLHYSLGAILAFVGLKMMLEHYVHVPLKFALGFIVVALAAGVVSSLISIKAKR